MKRRTLAAFCATAMLLSACQSDKLLSGGAQHAWHLKSGHSGDYHFNAAISDITLSYQDGKISGNAGVNRYNAPVKISGNHFALDGIIVATRMAGDIKKMQQESHYLNALSKITTLERGETRLTLKGDNTELIFQK